MADRRTRLKREAQDDPARKDFESHFLLSKHNSIISSVKERQETRKHEKNEIERSKRIQRFEEERRLEEEQRSTFEDKSDLNESRQEIDQDFGLDDYGYLESIAESDEETREAIDLLEDQISQAVQAAGDLLSSDLNSLDDYEMLGDGFPNKRRNSDDSYEKETQNENGEEIVQKGMQETTREDEHCNTSGIPGTHRKADRLNRARRAPSARTDPVGVTNDGSIMVDPLFIRNHNSQQPWSTTRELVLR